MPVSLYRCFSPAAEAQKLPVIQKGNVRAPKNIKIDGKLTEWGDELKAYNKATEVFYTVSNDDKKLYLTIKINRREIINKVINGGITFTINKGPKRTLKGGASITYPLINKGDKPYLDFKTAQEFANDKTVSVERKDSLMRGQNALLEEKAKFLKVTGLKDVDTLISVYNTDGIKLRSAFDNKMVYTYELAIDLKLLDLSSQDATTFKYNIRLNEIQPDHIPGVEISRGPTGEITAMNVYDAKLAQAFAASLSTTDLWGEYTLAK